VVLFEALTGQLRQILKGPGGRVMYVAFSRDSKLLATSTWYEGKGGAVRVWDLETRRELFTRPRAPNSLSGALAFSPEANRLVTEADDALQVWDARSGLDVQKIDFRPGGATSLCFSPNGRRLAVGVWQANSAKVFDWDGEKIAELKTLKSANPVATAIYSPDGQFLASGDIAGFKLWNAETFEEVRSIATPAAQIAFSPDSYTLLAAWTNGPLAAVHTFTRWDMTSGQELSPISVEMSAGQDRVFSHQGHDGKVLFIVSERKATYVKAIDPSTGKEISPRSGHTAPLNAVAINPDGRTLASAGEDMLVKLWDLATGQVIHTLSGHTEEVFALTFSQGGNLVASGGRDGTILLWDVDTGAQLRRIKGHSRTFTRISFSPDGRTLAAGAENGTLKRWDVESGKEDKPLPAHAGSARCVAFSPDGTRIASGGEDKSVRLLDTAGGVARKFSAARAVNEVAFSPDGRVLAAVCDGPQAALKLWNLETGQEQTLLGHTAAIRSLAFASQEPLLATCSDDGTVRLWEWTTREAQCRVIDFGRRPNGVRAVAFTPDGRYLVTANDNGTVYALQVRTP
jgi:WD40 repeat protein